YTRSICPTSSSSYILSLHDALPILNFRDNFCRQRFERNAWVSAEEFFAIDYYLRYFLAVCRDIALFIDHDTRHLCHELIRVSILTRREIARIEFHRVAAQGDRGGGCDFHFFYREFGRL